MRDEEGGRQYGGGAVVIAFPVRPAPDPRPDRLERALAGLLRATQEQAASVATWRARLGELRDNMAGLAGAVAHYQRTLAEVSARTDELGRAARRLESGFGG